MRRLNGRRCDPETKPSPKFDYIPCNDMFKFGHRRTGKAPSRLPRQQMRLRNHTFSSGMRGAWRNTKFCLNVSTSKGQDTRLQLIEMCSSGDQTCCLGKSNFNPGSVFGHEGGWGMRISHLSTVKGAFVMRRIDAHCLACDWTGRYLEPGNT
jgi:hypothetical protein